MEHDLRQSEITNSSGSAHPSSHSDDSRHPLTSSFPQLTTALYMTTTTKQQLTYSRFSYFEAVGVADFCIASKILPFKMVEFYWVGKIYSNSDRRNSETSKRFSAIIRGDGKGESG